MEGSSLGPGNVPQLLHRTELQALDEAIDVFEDDDWNSPQGRLRGGLEAWCECGLHVRGAVGLLFEAHLKSDQV